MLKPQFQIKAKGLFQSLTIFTQLQNSFIMDISLLISNHILLIQQQMINDTPSKRSLNATIRTISTTASVTSELERLVLEKQFNEERLMRELAYKDQALHILQNQKNLKIDQYQLAVDEEMLRLKRKYELEIDNLNVRILQLDRELRNSVGRQTQLELKLDSTTLDLDNSLKELIKCKDTIKDLSEQIGKLKDNNKGINSLNDQLNSRVMAMQDEIIVLLQVEASQAKQILFHQQNKKALEGKVLSLQLSIGQLQNHLKQVCENLRLKDLECTELKLIIDRMDSEIHMKESAIQKLIVQLQQLMRVQKIREAEVKQLMRENQRLYNEVSGLRHQLHQMAIAHNFTV